MTVHAHHVDSFSLFDGVVSRENPWKNPRKKGSNPPAVRRDAFLAGALPQPRRRHPCLVRRGYPRSRRRTDGPRASCLSCWPSPVRAPTSCFAYRESPPLQQEHPRPMPAVLHHRPVPLPLPHSRYFARCATMVSLFAGDGMCVVWRCAVRRKPCLASVLSPTTNGSNRRAKQSSLHRLAAPTWILHGSLMRPRQGVHRAVFDWSSFEFF